MVFQTSNISGIINLFVRGSVSLLAAIACSLSNTNTFGIPNPKATRGSSIECFVIATSMFLSAANNGVLTAEHILVGTRGSERIHLYVNNNKGTITSDECAFTDSIGYYNDASSTYVYVISASNSGKITVDTDYLTVRQNIKVFNDVEIQKINGLKFGSNNYGPVNITIDGVSYTVIAQRNS